MQTEGSKAAAGGRKHDKTADTARIKAKEEGGGKMK